MGMTARFLHRKVHDIFVDPHHRGMYFSVMSCKVCSELQANLEAAARELSRAVNDARVAIQPIAGMAAGNRIEDAERALRSAGEDLEKHQALCEFHSKSVPKSEI
jgi:hypothetical protein